jgi:hypothetical protein
MFRWFGSSVGVRLVQKETTREEKARERFYGDWKGRRLPTGERGGAGRMKLMYSAGPMGGFDGEVVLMREMEGLMLESGGGRRTRDSRKWLVSLR